MQKILWNSGWTFARGGGSPLEGMLTGRKPPEPVTLPHDASILSPRDPSIPMGGNNGYYPQENYIYTKSFEVTREDLEGLIWIEFEGVYHNAFVYVNGVYVGKQHYGYTGFTLEITNHLHSGMNEVKVVVKNAVPSARWYTGGGIYRDVWLIKAGRLHVAPGSLRLTTKEADEALAVIEAEADITWRGPGVMTAVWEVGLAPADMEAGPAGDMHEETQSSSTVFSARIPVTLMEGQTVHYRQMLYVQSPKLWDDRMPNLYTVQSRLISSRAGAAADEVTEIFGIRKLTLDPIRGLQVNGRTVKLRGGCIHHVNGILGAAEYAHAADVKVRKLKAAGFNAIRSAHNPISAAMLRACDRYGMYVIDEYTDMWTSAKSDFDYSMYQEACWEDDLAAMAAKDYNHPCVLMYSIGNEIAETGSRLAALWGKRLADRLHALDPSRYTTNGINVMLSVMGHVDEIMADYRKHQQARQRDEAGRENDGVSAGIRADDEINTVMANNTRMMEIVATSEITSQLTQEAASHLDIVGYNYAAGRYEGDGVRFPGRLIFGSETYPRELDINWPLVEKLPYCLGDFDWAAWDYIGEAGVGYVHYGDGFGSGFIIPEYPARLGGVGDLDILGDMRPVAVWRQMIWSHYTDEVLTCRDMKAPEKPWMVYGDGWDVSKPYIAVRPPAHHGEQRHMNNWAMTDAIPSWTWSGWENRPVTVEVYAAADEIELFAEPAAETVNAPDRPMASGSGSISGMRRIGRMNVGEEKRDQAVFETVYIPGRLTAVAYTQGCETGRCTLVTAGKPAQLMAFADRGRIPADGSDIAYVDVYITDDAGSLNADQDVDVTIRVENGICAGFGSAIPDAEGNYYDETVRTWHGRAQAAIRGCGKAGEIVVLLTAEGLESAKVSVTAQ